MIQHRALTVVTALAVVAFAGCDDGDADTDALRAGFDAAVEAADVDEVDGPNETTSKDVSYLTGSGLIDGDPASAVEQVAAGLRDDGWDVSEPTPAGEGMAVVANDGTVAVQVGVYTTVGVNAAPEGSVIAQIQVAEVGAGLAWTS